MAQIQTPADDICAFVDVLTNATTGEPFGYHVFGNRRGPLVMVVGEGDTAQATFDRVISIPSLSTLRGDLLMVRSDLMTVVDEHDVMTSLTAPLEHTLALPQIARTAFTVRRQVNDILRLCAELGKISIRA